MSDKKIIIYDDNIALLESQKLLIDISDGLECVYTSTNTINAIDEIEIFEPDLILMDIDMPDENGIKATAKIKSRYPHTIIIIQTVLEDNNNIFEALRAGANGYILKKTSPEKFILLIKEAINGEVAMTGTVANKILSYFKNNIIENEYQLTKRETEILKLLVDGYSYKMIAGQLLITFDTVKNHLSKIYRKLQVNSATEAVILAIKKNIV